MNPSTYQEIMGSQSLDMKSILAYCTKSETQLGQIEQVQEKKPKPSEESLKCPRCDSTNTKFCYYNNYSLTQPRYFCKSCRRYWTKGGTLRNVPVGGGCRKNRRSSSSSSCSSSSTSSRSRVTINGTAPSLVTDVGGHEDHGIIPLLGNLSNNPHFEQLFYGGFVGNGNLGDVENGRGNIVNNHQLGMQFDHHNLYHNHNQEMIMSNPSSGSSTPTTTTTTIKQEILGLPWQLTNNYEGNYVINGGGGAETWSTGMLGYSWHGLLNSPLT